MIQGHSKTEANYRAIQTDSSSSLKEFSMDRKKYHKKYVLGENVEDKENRVAEPISAILLRDISNGENECVQ